MGPRGPDEGLDVSNAHRSFHSELGFLTSVSLSLLVQ